MIYLDPPEPRYIEWGPPFLYHASLVGTAPFLPVLDELRKVHTVGAIAQASGLSRYEVNLIVNHHRDRIRVDTAQKLRAGCLSLLPSEGPSDG